MPIGFEDIWDFHTDLRYMVNLAPDKAYLSEQIDLAAAGRLGGLFSAAGRKAGAPQAEQLKLLEADIRLIRQTPGLTVVLQAADLPGTGRQVLHAEGVYFIEREGDLELLDWMWEQGLRGLGPQPGFISPYLVPLQVILFGVNSRGDLDDLRLRGLAAAAYSARAALRNP